jgi:hypothetical protein
MLQRSWLVALFVAMLVLPTLAFAGGGGGGGGGFGGGGGMGGGAGGGGFGGGGAGGPGGRGAMDPAAAKQTALDNAKTAMGATDAEWAKISPLLGKVYDARLLVPAAPTGRGGGRGGAGGGGRGGAATPSPAAEAQTALTTAVTDNAAADVLAKALATYRTARDKARADLAAAQKDLKGAVNAKQEAVCVSRGYLE